ncbi:TPR repeat protein [Shewanella piezotolerans WP3]|uniref:TPR repeat protein n=1 Tax=Shewanella piezotolerans (strain WP3 / JCM 13877) TaxID=225849 RepID=B8CV89_SHEPW|nr:tetratricopeptide repeat protein [Shewanella piezotolerans]ACJ31565.1 TPR repeat protein [Shewanella piezotolerans WP3]
MKYLILVTCCLTVLFSEAAEDFHWDGGELQFDFSSIAYQQREPKITQEEYLLLNDVVGLVKQQRQDDAIAELNLQLVRSPSAALWFSLAQLQQQQEQMAAALASFRHAIVLLPHFTRAHESLGLLLTQQGDYDGARSHLRQAASQGAPAQIYAMLGYGYLQTQQPQAAKAAYSHALMLAGDNRQWQRGLLHAAMAAGDSALANSLTEQLLAASPEDAQLHRLRASLAQQQQLWEQAIASLEIAQQLQPDDAVQWQLTQLYFDQGYYTLAQPHLQQLLESGIDGRQQRLLEVADYLIGQQQPQQAEALLISLLSNASLSASQRSHGLTSQALLLTDNNSQRSQSKQVGLLNKALRLDPLNGPALIALAKRYETNELVQAETLYRRAAALSSVRLEALQRHAQLLLEQQAYHRAQQLLRQAVKQAPNDLQLRDNLALVTRMVQSQG